MLRPPSDPRVPAALDGRRFLRAALREEAHVVSEVRGRGLWFGVGSRPRPRSARAVRERLLELGVLAKDTQATTVRLDRG